MKLYDQWRELPPEFFTKINISQLFLSFSLLIPSIFINSFRWPFVLKRLNASISWFSATRIWYQSQAGRFLPGGFWNYAARFYLSKNKMNNDMIVTSIYLETIIRVISELLIFLITIPFFHHLQGNIWIAVVCILLILVFLIFMGKPNLISHLGKIKPLRSLFKEPDQIQISSVKTGHLYQILIYNILTTLIVLFTFYIFLHSFFPVTWQQLPMIAGSLSASIVFGFLFPFAPNGLGVREGILTLLLSQLMPFSAAAVIALATRVWLSIGEAFLIFLFFIRFPTKNNP